MATERKLRRGTEVEHQTFTGASGELTAVTDKPGLRLHDGVTPGGHTIPTTSRESDAAPLGVISEGSTELRTLGERFSEAVNIKDFGVVGDGITDDSDALQAALQYSYDNQRNLIGGNYTVRTTKTIYIGNYPDSTESITLDFGGIRLRPDDSVNIVVDSGRHINGVWQTTWGEPNETYMSFMTKFEGLQIEGSSDAAKDGRTGIRFKDWHYGCEIKRVATRNFETGHHNKNCFSAEWDSCTSFNTNANNRTGTGFIFEAANNLMTVKRCWVGNMGTGYELRGGITAFHMNNCGIEGAFTGVRCTNYVYDLAIRDCYVEGIRDVGFDLQDNVLACTLDSNYMNFGLSHSTGAYILDYKPGPNTNIRYLATNEEVLASGVTFEDILFKDTSTTFGYNKVYVERPAKQGNLSVDSFAAPAGIPEDVDWNEVQIHPNVKAEIVNGLAKGQYAGRMTTGTASSTGFEFIDLSDTTCELETRYTASNTGKLHVALRASASGIWYITGELVGRGSSDLEFYEYLPANRWREVSPGSGTTIVMPGLAFHSGDAANYTFVVNNEVYEPNDAINTPKSFRVDMATNTVTVDSATPFLPGDVIYMTNNGGGLVPSDRVSAAIVDGYVRLTVNPNSGNNVTAVVGEIRLL
ncbi:tail protein [Vibrio phage D148]